MGTSAFHLGDATVLKLRNASGIVRGVGVKEMGGVYRAKNNISMVYTNVNAA